MADEAIPPAPATPAPDPEVPAVPGGLQPDPASGTPPPPPPPAEAARQGEPPVAVDALIESQLAEIFLLLDNISAAQSKTLPLTMGDDDLFTDSTKKTWLEQVCDIRWPPAGSPANDGRNAAKLLRIRDMLNAAAAPATGYTIAFTLMMAGESRHRPVRRRRSTAEDTLVAGADAERSRETGDDGPSASARREFAGRAFPMLEQNVPAKKFSWTAMQSLLLGWLVLTCLFSWHVATGVALLDRVDSLQRAVYAKRTAAANTDKDPTGADEAGDAGLAAAGAGRTPPDTGAAVPAGGAMPAPEGSAPGAAGGGDPAAGANSVAAARQTTTGGKSDTQTDDGRSTRKSGAESELVTLSSALDQADRNLANWLPDGGWLSRLLLTAPGGQDEQRFASHTSADGKHHALSEDANVEWAQVYIKLLAGTILPILYGILGAGAAVVRSVSAKLREASLNPRDLGLGWVQIALGAVIACCIGLFVPGSGDSDHGSGLLGSIPLTLSALCFIAGFGVEGVFQALEALVRRLFNLNGSSGAATGG